MKHAFLFGACAVLSVAAWSAATAADTVSAIARGGRLYDNWYLELDERPPTQKHPAYPAGGALAGEPASTWRCVECHGWDYRGRDGAPGSDTGIKGIHGMANADPERIVAILLDSRHRYGEVMDRDDLNHIALFVSKGQTPLMARIDPATGKVPGNPQAVIAVYQTVCATCHGSDGQGMTTLPPLGEMTRANPWRTLHNVVNGHAGGVMPALRAHPESLAMDIVAYLQQLAPRDLAASITRGGRLYDNWMRETARPAPAGKHPAYPAQIDAKHAADTWRCRECHGPDYRGKDGAYGSGRHATGIKGIAAMRDASPARIQEVLTNDTHRYRGVLSPRDLLDLANFVSRGQHDMAGLIDPATGRFKGDGKPFEPYFQTMCATCHGKEGRSIRTMPPLGRVVHEEPWRALHSVLNGHPGESMPPLRAFPENVVGGLLAYSQGLPEKK